MASHSVADARNHLSDLIDRAVRGEEVVITRHGAPIARLTAVLKAGRPIDGDQLDWLRKHRVGVKAPDIDSGKLVSQMRDEDDERLLRR